MKNETLGGYVGVLLGVLVTSLCIVLLFVWYMNTPVLETEEGIQPLTASGTVPANKLEEYHADIDAANGIQNSVNEGFEDINQFLED